MSFFYFVLLAIIAYLAWRIADQIPDIIFRMSEIQRDVAELRRMQLEAASSPAPKAPAAKRARKPAAKKAPVAKPESGKDVENP